MFRSLPPLLLGLLLAAYWGRVLRMAYKARRRTGRAANLLPGEKVGKIIRIVWGPLVVIWVAHPFVVAFVHFPQRLLRPLYFEPGIAWPALIVAIACLLLTRWCWNIMGRYWRMGIDPDERNPLLASGPFACVRHPIYVLSSILMLSTMVMIPSPLMLAAGALHILLLVWESRREERHLLSVHGERYAQYQQNTGSFWPRSWTDCLTQVFRG